MNINKILKSIFRSGYRFLIYNNSVVRKEWVSKKIISIPKGENILDAGAGELSYRVYCKHLNYISQDFGGYDGEGNSEGLQTKSRDNSKIDITCDIIDIPVGNESFDHILCVEVLEHIPYPIKAIKEFNRILKNGGSLILTAPFNSLTHYAPFYFYNGFSKYFYKEILKNNGFEILELEMNGNYFDYLSGELGRIPSCFKKYTNYGFLLTALYLLFILPILLILKIARKNSYKSSELLTTGIHIKAIKKK
jgi:ubiquinone/menaquinone biosynthesis C-methylase UbiE